MLKIVTFLVLACAGAVFVHADSPPPYYESLQTYRDARSILEVRILESPDEVLPIDKYKRHYLVLSNFISQFAILLHDYQVSYNDTYLSVIQEQVPYALINYKEVIQTTIRLVDNTDNEIKDLADLIDGICTVVSPSNCDVQLDVIIQLNEAKYGEEAEALLSLAKASDSYKKIAEELYDVAEIYNEMAFLINGRDILRTLIFDLADFMTYIDHEIRPRPV